MTVFNVDFLIRSEAMGYRLRLYRPAEPPRGVPTAAALWAVYGVASMGKPIEVRELFAAMEEALGDVAHGPRQQAASAA